ncbi:MAG: clan AA aspartic protease [Candidatus Hermodarchaeota archaeon]
MKFSFSYQKPIISDIEAPYIPIILSDPLEQTSVEIKALVDTGYDGEILIPQDMYETLNLKTFEYSLDVVSMAETASGEHIRLLSASGAAKIKGSDITIIITIDSHQNCKEVLIGRKYLESYDILLKGQEKELEIEFVAEK